MKDKAEILNAIDLKSDPTRLRLLVNGIVQGVGFRPTVYRFARSMHLAGFVKNTSHGVVIEIEGKTPSIKSFLERLIYEAPPLSRIENIEAEEVGLGGDGEFVIRMSDEPGSPETLFPVDTAVCEDCLREISDPEDKRYRYPFINCTNCGPRFTIIEGLPYDRRYTTMNEFEMDDFCRVQYEDPSDRRFHAEPISCPDCGPALSLVDSEGGVIEGDPIAKAQELISKGSTVAVKGLGGYHLACLAMDDEAVTRLRRRKKRPTKPFALMFRNIEMIERFCIVSDVERRLLLSPQAPIVLLRKREDSVVSGPADPEQGKLASGRLSEEIAPNNSYIGAFLPYTPLHHLLMEAFDVLVMTSANFTDEPLISNEDELDNVLGSIADVAITHNRRIAHKCDDSILFVSAGRAVPVRRARGYVPEPVPLLNEPSRAILALGGQMKGTFALSRGAKAFLSPHLGDLGDYRSQKNFVRELEDFERLLELSPDICVHDLHPDYFTTRLASRLDVRHKIAVQHHHAHAVSVMVEHGLKGKAIGVSFDGTGYGTDGKLWGGEFLLASPTHFSRLAHMKYVPLPGSEAAVHEPWRMALSFLRDAYLEDDSLAEGAVTGDEEFAKLVDRFFEGFPAAVIIDLVNKGINSPLTSSIGRLFDAVAFLLGLKGRVSFEAEAAIALESLALSCNETPYLYRFDFLDGGVSLQIDPAPLIRAVVEDILNGKERSFIAASFHASVAEMVVKVLKRLSEETSIRDAVLSGGVFQNRLLLDMISKMGEETGINLYTHIIVPPNDGGISLGQIQVASSMLEGGMIEGI